MTIYKGMETIEPLNSNEINHPKHYTQGDIETIDYIIDKLNKEQFEGFCIGNVIKYVSRFKLKGGYQDIKKARWYLDKLIELEEQHA